MEGKNDKMKTDFESKPSSQTRMNNCQAQPRLKLSSEYCQNKPRLDNVTELGLKNVPTENGSQGKLSPKNDFKSSKIECPKVQVQSNLGARPKTLKKTPEKISCKPKSKLGPNSGQRGKSELEIAFAKIKSKRETKMEIKSPETPKSLPRTSPTKLLFKASKSPKSIMREIKSKLEGNRVKNLVRNLETYQKMGISPKTPKSAKGKAFGALKRKEKKALPPKRKLSVDKNQPRINLFFGQKKISSDLDEQILDGSE